jgi:hypothetical protein
MKRIVIINGLIAGVIVSAMLVITQPLLEKGILNYENGTIVGYTSMVVALSLVFVGIKSYRDQHLKGSISFGQAFKVGILIALIASVVYALSWEVYYNIAASDFMDKYTQHYLAKMKEEGASDAEIIQMRMEMEKFNEQYKNPIVRFGVTLVEILPVGLLITLISAALLRNKKFLSANPS